MPSDAPAMPTPSGLLWAGRALSGLLVVFLLFIGAMNVMKPSLRLQEYAEFGYSPTIIAPIGILLVLCTTLYAIPQTCMFGAILLTAYFGGAIVTHMRIGQSAYFEILIGVLLWLGLYLRDAKVRALIPWRN